MTVPIIIDVTMDFDGRRSAIAESGTTAAAVVVEIVRGLLCSRVGRQACADAASFWHDVLEGMPEGAVQLLAAARADIP